MLINRISYVTPEGVDIDWWLRSRITIILGDSATGKSYAYNSFKKQRALDTSKHVDSIFSNMLFISQYDSANLNALIDCRDKIIFIDNAEILFQGKPEMGELVSGDLANQYIIFARSAIGVSVSPNAFAEVERSEGKMTLRYSHCSQGETRSQ